MTDGTPKAPDIDAIELIETLATQIPSSSSFTSASLAQQILEQTRRLHAFRSALVVGREAGAKAHEMVEAQVQEAEVGKTYQGKVKTTTAFGAFVEILPGVEGLVHISELQHGRTEKTEDVVKKGDSVTVKVLEVDEHGKMRLSRKAVLEK
ncbi:MAG: S1 RNA-binding domain-containing protein [Gemmatimonadales bacterium]|nr:S1 RNA-binding domain-containing protein [Gemmatimonadales bacterium]